MITNGIKHDLKVGQRVWSLTCTCEQEFIIERITPKRIVCREIDGSGKGRRLSTSNHCPSNLFVFDTVKQNKNSSWF